MPGISLLPGAGAGGGGGGTISLLPSSGGGGGSGTISLIGPSSGGSSPTSPATATASTVGWTSGGWHDSFNVSNNALFGEKESSIRYLADNWLAGLLDEPQPERGYKQALTLIALLIVAKVLR